MKRLVSCVGVVEGGKGEWTGKIGGPDGNANTLSSVVEDLVMEAAVLPGAAVGAARIGVEVDGAEDGVVFGKAGKPVVPVDDMQVVVYLFQEG